MSHVAFDPRAFRNALGTFPTGVAVITTATATEVPLVGITVNSFTSVSLEPPLVLWCLAKKSDRYHVFTKASSYTVSILGAEHQEVSSRLAKHGPPSFDGIALQETLLGPPAVADAVAVFECQAHMLHDTGDHAILIGEVIRFAYKTGDAPLVFFRGKYSSLAPEG